MSRLLNRLRGTEVMNALYIAAGLILCTLGYDLFLIPNNIAAGGFTGAAQLISHFTGWPVGILMLAMNVPLFIVSMRSMGLRFGIRSLIASVLLSLMIDLIPLPQAAEDTWLATLFGGMMTGIGFGLILRGNATTGGTDMLAKLIHKVIPRAGIGAIMSILDGAVILASAFVFDTKLALYALITMILCNAVLDFILEGPNSAHAYFIISDRYEEIAEVIMKELERGATLWSGKGMYTGEERQVLLCAVSRREALALRRIIHRVDPSAFVISTRARETYGEGFRML